MSARDVYMPAAFSGQSLIAVHSPDVTYFCCDVQATIWVYQPLVMQLALHIPPAGNYSKGQKGVVALTTGR